MITAKPTLYSDEMSISLRDRIDKAFAYLTFDPLHLNKEISFWVGRREVFVVEKYVAKRHEGEPIYRAVGNPKYILRVKFWDRRITSPITKAYEFATLALLEKYLKEIR